MPVSYANDLDPMCLSEVLINADDKLAVLRQFMGDVLLCCHAAGMDAEDIERATRLADKLDIVSDDDDEEEGLTYSGWDARHDSNRAEGRPIGNQWSDDGVDYSNGFKVYTNT